MYYLGIIISSIIAYIIGSISWSIIIVKWRGGIDIRTVGSRNAGATNTTRVLGKFWGFTVVTLDALKVAFATLITIGISSLASVSDLFKETSYFIPAIFVLIGHCFPIFHKFKGGKAVACFLGLLFITNILYLIIFLFIWFATVYFTEKVSVASIIAAVVIVVIIWMPWLNGINAFTYEWNSFDILNNSDSWLKWFSWSNNMHVVVKNTFMSSQLEQNIIILLGATILWLRHKPNILRIIIGTEPKTYNRKKTTNPED